MIPYGRQDIDQSDIDAVVAVLRSDFLTQGPQVPRFEETVARAAGAAHAVAANSATSALHIACLALGVGPGDRVWTTPITFVASANCALYCGAQVDFVDIDAETYNLSVESLANKLAAAKQTGTLPKIVIPVHLAGQSCDMASIGELAAAYGFRVIEDASHAVGAEYLDRPVGDCRYSDITVFSYHPVKIVTTAEGGLATTNEPALAAAMGLFRSHGITRDEASMRGCSEGGWYYQQLELGFNYRLTELQAALGISQFARLERFVARRRDLARRYDTKLAGLPITLPHQRQDTSSSWHLYIIRCDEARTGRSRRDIFDGLRRRGIGVNVHYIPVYLQPYYRELGFEPGLCPQAERYYEEAISIPLYAGMSDEDQDRVVEAVTEETRL